MRVGGSTNRRVGARAVALGLLAAGVTLAVPAAAAGAAAVRPAGHPAMAVTHRAAGVTASGRRFDASAVAATDLLPTVQVPRRARISFTVKRKTLLLPAFFPTLPKAAGRYVAFYLPAAGQGWAFLPDAGSIRHWPAELDFGQWAGFMTLYPGHTYTLFVAVDHPAAIPMPVPMNVTAVRPARFAAAVVIHPIHLATPASVAAMDSAADRLGRLPLSSTAVALDWNADPSPAGNTTADACRSALPVISCGSDNNLSYFNDTQELGPLGGARQYVVGEAYDRPLSATTISGYAVNLPTPFNAATLLGFAIDPPVQ